jgi:uncharacterized membrane protein
MIVATLSLAGIFVALYLLLYKLGMIGNLSCSVGSCETVNSSKWATFLGLPVAGWGARFEDSVVVSTVLLGVAATGLVFSLYLTYLELFVIDAICQWCVVSAIIVTLIFIVCVADYRATRTAGTQAKQD